MAANVAVSLKNSNLDFALKKLKKKLKDNKVMLYFEEHIAFEKPSLKNRKKRLQAIRRNEYELRENKEKY